MTSSLARSGSVRTTRNRWIGATLALVLTAGGALAQVAPPAAAETVVAAAAAPTVTSITASAELNIRPVERAWKLKVKVSKPVLAGELTITDEFGDTVRTVEVNKSNTKNVVTATWDGRDDTATDVPEDVDYTWELVMPAKDGSGNLTDAGERVTGTVHVINESLGEMQGVKPKISDTTPVTGQTIKAKPGTWTPSTGISYTYQWYRDSVANEIANADGASYTVTTADFGHTLLVKVSGVVDGWTADSTDRVSAATAAVGKGTLSPTPTPKITGTPKVGETLTAVPGNWGDHVTPSYQWYQVLASGKKKALAGETASTYVVAAELVGKRVRLRVTGSATGYVDTSRYSKTTAKVAKGKFSDAQAPAIYVPGSAPTVGMTLVAVPGTYTPAATSYSYQWYRLKGTTKTAITKATKDTYTTKSSDAGYSFMVQVIGKRAGYTNAAKLLSPATSAVQAGILGVKPQLSDTTPTVGDVLSVTAATGASAWGPSGVTVSYAWYADGSPVGTDPTYTVAGADAGKAITVELTGTLTGFVPVTMASAASEKVAKAVFDTDPDVIDLVLSTEYLHHTITAKVETAEGSPTPDSVAWQWYTVSGTTATPISGAITNVLDFSADTNGTYRVVATITKAGYETLVLTKDKDVSQ